MPTTTRRACHALVLWAFSAAALAQTLPSARYGLPALDHAPRLELPAVDQAKLLAEDAKAARDTPLRYATPQRTAVSAQAQAKAARGRWDSTADGHEVWRLPIHAPGALSIDLKLSKMFLPQGAELYLASADGRTIRGPYTDADNTSFGAFYTPLVPGADAVLEVSVPTALKPALELELATVYHGYRDVLADAAFGAKSLSCEIDVACPEGDAYRSQSRAVARYLFEGFGCSGQLLNNGAGDNRRLFHTANHCVSTPGEAHAMVLYWKYESPVCRTPGSAASGTPLPDSSAVIQTGGATLLATHAGSDTTLVELNAAIPPPAQPFFDGWDRSGIVPGSTAVIHHPNADEKKISLSARAPVVNNTPVDLDEISYDAGASIDVTYTRGTTEAGSSGAGLLSPEGRVIGQLGGGPAGSCQVGITDTYGRLSAAWDGGGTPTTRLRELLDPNNAGLMALDGRESCAPPHITLTGPASGAAGTPLTLSAGVVGAGPFTVRWDVDDDRLIDRTTSGVASTTSITVNYPAATRANVRVAVTDATGCTGELSRAINVMAQIVVPTAGIAHELCGNGDAQIDPGERWQIPVTLANAGSAALSGGYAIYAKPPVGAMATPLGPDAGGYTAGDDGNGCGYQFIDLEPLTGALPLTGAGTGGTPGDDGRTDVLPVAPFTFYGSRVAGLVMSTNGYLSTSATESGGDNEASCGLAPTDGARLNVLEDDLELGPQDGAGLRRFGFASCPRPAESVRGPTACTVFEWSHLGQYSSLGAQGDFDLEAIVYPATGQIVYQYRRAPDDEGGAGHISIQNAAASAGLEYACGAPVVRTGRSVCFFAPNAKPLVSDPGVRIETPAVALPGLPPGVSVDASVIFDVRADADCGAPLSIDYVGTVDANSASMRSTALLSTLVGGGHACTVATGCAAEIAPLSIADGFYANAKRFGNGEGVFTIPSGNQNVLFAAWFTGERDRDPSWLIVQGPLVDNQAIAPVLRLHQNPGPVFGVSATQVGTAQVTVLNANSYVFTFSVDGAAGGQIESVLYPTRSRPNRTGAWYAPAESGWGQVIDDHRNGSASEEVAINYIFDAGGNPVWTLGATGGLDSGSMSLNTYRVQCPTCANFPDFGAFPLPAGALTRSYSDLTHGVLSTQMTLPAPLSGTWIRSNLPIQMLSRPGPQ